MKDNLKEIMKDTLEKYPRAQSIHLYGSQNYGLETRNSNVFLYMIEIPSLGDLIGEKKKICEMISDKKLLVKISDLRSIAHVLSIMDPTYTELVYSPYSEIGTINYRPCFVNDIAKQIIKDAGTGLNAPFARATSKSVKSEYIKAVRGTRKGQKSLSKILRLNELLKQTAAGIPVSALNWLPFDNRDLMMAAKKGELSKEEAKKFAETAYEETMCLTAQSQIPETSIFGQLKSAAEYEISRCVEHDILE